MTDHARSNGLPAASFTNLGHVDPGLVPDLLRRLADLGIAARSEPVTGTVGPYLDVHPPTLPRDEVSVDTAQLAAAREALVQLSTDMTFHELVAGLDDEPADNASSSAIHPVFGSLGPDGVWRANDSPYDPDLADRLLNELSGELEERYEPPPPPHIPKPSWQATLSGLLIVLGMALLALRPDSLSRFAGACAFAAGLWGLVLRLRDDRRDPQDPSDDGARV